MLWDDCWFSLIKNYPNQPFLISQILFCRKKDVYTNPKKSIFYAAKNALIFTHFLTYFEYRSVILCYISIAIRALLCFRICTSNHMFKREIGINLPSSLFWNFGISRVKRRRFQNFKKWTRYIFPKFHE